MRFSVKKVLLIFLLAASNWLQAQQVSEYALKASWIAKFASFVEWPNGQMQADEFRIYVIGDNPFDDLLDLIYKNRRLKKRKIKIYYIKNLEELKRCEILFISKSERYNLSKILESTKNKGILTIGDTRGYAHRGVHINFYSVDNRLKFEINEKEAKKSGLKIDALLLDYGKII